MPLATGAPVPAGERSVASLAHSALNGLAFLVRSAFIELCGLRDLCVESAWRPWRTLRL